VNAEIVQPPQLSTGRLILLGLSSVVLCMSFIMSVFAPFPIALAVILYGRAKGFFIGSLGLALSFGFAAYYFQDLTLFGFYAFVFIFGFGIAEIVTRGISPIKGIVTFGLGFLLLLAGAFTYIVKSENTTPEKLILKQLEASKDKLDQQKKLIEESAQEGSIEVLQLLDRPDLIAKQMIESLPGYLFMGVFVMLWFNMFLVLKSRRLLLSANDYPYSEKNLLNFKVPFGFVIVLAIGLALVIFDDKVGPHSEVVGYTIIKCLGIFYFFQGFGIFSDLLSFLGIMGFFRTLIVMVVIFTAHYVIVAAGLFDNWFDFRKYFVKPKIED
jgi:MFS family permease